MSDKLKTISPHFNNVGEVKSFLAGDSDLWLKSIVEGYFDMFGPNVKPDDEFIQELNEFLDYELNSFQKGYEEYTDGNTNL